MWNVAGWNRSLSGFARDVKRIKESAYYTLIDIEKQNHNGFNHKGIYDVHLIVYIICFWPMLTSKCVCIADISIWEN